MTLAHHFCPFLRSLRHIFFFYLSHPTAENVTVDIVYQVGSWFILSWWICHDAAQCRFVLPMSYGFLILIASPLYAPIYMFQTRGWMGFWTIGLFIVTYTGIVLIFLVALTLMMV
jgi:hypothetical protein